MRSVGKTYNKTIVTELAEAISSFNVGDVRSLLSDEGSFAMQNENSVIVNSGKEEFISWLNRCYRKFPFGGRFRKRLGFNIVQSLHHSAGCPIIVFEEGSFPVLSADQAKNEQSGLVIKSDNNKITGIEFCFLIMKTENPFIYEKRYLNPGQ
jgi:hypothetical protein